MCDTTVNSRSIFFLLSLFRALPLTVSTWCACVINRETLTGSEPLTSLLKTRYDATKQTPWFPKKRHDVHVVLSCTLSAFCNRRLLFGYPRGAILLSPSNTFLDNCEGGARSRPSYIRESLSGKLSLISPSVIFQTSWRAICVAVT